MDDLNYFVCTLGQAVEVKKRYPHQFKTINEFLDHQAQVIPASLAVGFPTPAANRDAGQWRSDLLCKHANSVDVSTILIAVSFSGTSHTVHACCQYLL